MPNQRNCNNLSLVLSWERAWKHWLSSGLLFSPVLVLMVFTFYLTVLKETPAFWHNWSGYSVQLRLFVENFYYLILFADAVLLLFISFGAVVYRYFFKKNIFFVIFWLVLFWSMLASSVVFLVQNNVENLLHGRDLHWHPTVQSLPIEELPKKLPF